MVNIEPTIKNRLRENSREMDFFHAGQEGIRHKTTSILIPDGPWIDLEKENPDNHHDLLLSVRVHSRGSRDTGDKNQQIRFDFYREKLQILLGDVFGPNSKGVPLGRDSLSLLWNSDSGLNGQGEEVPNDIRDAIADKILEVLGMIMNHNTTYRLNEERVTKRRDCSDEASRILYLVLENPVVPC